MVNGLLTPGVNVWEFLSHSGSFYKTSKGIRDMQNQNFWAIEIKISLKCIACDPYQVLESWVNANPGQSDRKEALDQAPVNFFLLRSSSSRD
jgi:hypothetical protein